MVSWLKSLWPGARSSPPVDVAGPAVPEPTHQASLAGIKLLHNAEESVVDIIFVHGLTGDQEKTWTAKTASKPWPQALLPSKIRDARILAFGYDANVMDWRGLVSKNTIGNHATNLLTTLATYREEDDTALVTARQRPERHLQNVLQYTRGIAFLGTPHHGSGLASWAEKLAKAMGLVKQTNSRIVEVLERDSEVLARIQDSFHTMIRARNQDGLQPIDIACFYEELPLPGVGVVVPSCSAILPGYIPIGIHANHMDMTKFISADDAGFRAVVGELHRWVKALRPAGATLTDSSADTAESATGEREDRQVLRITQEGSRFTGSTTVSGGSLFQGNFAGSGRGSFG
ncbi:MAG: hypothetical protein Q9165_005058 [Trypethelium subeluteriae]